MALCSLFTSVSSLSSSLNQVHITFWSLKCLTKVNKSWSNQCIKKYLPAIGKESAMTGSPIKPITGCGIVPTVRPRPSGWRQTRVLSELTETTWRRRSEPNGLFETCKEKCCQIVVGEKIMAIWVVTFLKQEYKSKLTYSKEMILFWESTKIWLSKSRINWNSSNFVFL